MRRPFFLCYGFTWIVCDWGENRLFFAGTIGYKAGGPCDVKYVTRPCGCL
jgi:hypothetical protein